MAFQRPIRICGASGSVFDRRPMFADMLKSSEQIDLIVGDWMSEGNMPAAASRKLAGEDGFEQSFIEVIEPALPTIAARNIKVAVNAGACDPQLLQQKVQSLIDGLGLKLKTAWISGDDVIEQVKSRAAVGDASLSSIDTGDQLSGWDFKPVAAQAYLGSFGVAEAFKREADIVICGRVADASVCMGGAIWWHDWKRENLPEIASALIAGHLVECSTYVTGANFSGFKSVPNAEDPGLPIAEISANGDLIITKIKGTGGMVTSETVKAQLLYEIQGPWYFNSDVTAVLDHIRIEDIGLDMVKVSGVGSLPPPPTTKVGITGVAGYTAELHWALVGLDIPEKAALLEKHLRLSLGDVMCEKFAVLKFTVSGTAAPNPQSQNSATVDFRIFVQSKDKEDLSFKNFIRPVWDVIMCTYPGATPHAATNSAIPRPWYEYWVALIDQSEIHHSVHLHDGTKVDIDPPSVTQSFPLQQPSSETSNPASLVDFGETVDCPLGYVVHARSGDKGCNANIGLFVRNSDEYEWLRSLLTTQKMIELLGDEYSGNQIDRFELPEIWAVHFLCHQHLDRGINSSSTYDILGKNVAEFIRSRWVAVPKKFLDRGKI